MTNFPVKFPVSREFVWRLVRIPMRRQPASPALRENITDTRRKAANGGLLRILYQSPGSDFRHSQNEMADSGGLNRSTQHFILKERWSVV